MARTDINTVKSIIQTALADSAVNDYITHANNMVTRVVGGEGLTAAVLKDIETWLTAHLIAISKERQPHEEKIGDIWVRFTENPQGWLSQTTYGQTVLFLDSSGQFQKTTMKKSSIRAIKQIND